MTGEASAAGTTSARSNPSTSPSISTYTSTAAPVGGLADIGGVQARGDDGIFRTVDDAVVCAEGAQQALMTLTLEKRKQLISAMRDVGIDNAESLAEYTVRETGLGRYKDKIQKILLAATKTPGTEDLSATTYTGDRGLTLVEAAPFGVIGSITPTTNPAPTIINNAISMVAAGNAVVFNPHPGAKGVTNKTIQLINRAIVANGGPKWLLNSVAEPTLATSQAIMDHPQIKVLMVTGGGAVVQAGMTCPKRCIAAGPGNPPVIVDDTAFIRKSAKAIVDGASFDNNVLCTAEKEVFAFRNITDQLKEAMKSYGAFEIDARQTDRLIKLVLENPSGEHPVVNKKWVGQDAKKILAAIDLNVSDDTRLIIAEVDRDTHPFVRAELMMPILPIVRVDTIEEALEKAKIAEHGNKHTACMHSQNLANLSYVARNIETTIFVKNAPSYAGLGFGGEGFTTLSIAGPTGEGLTSARTFTRQRRCILVDAFRIV